MEVRAAVVSLRLCSFLFFLVYFCSDFHIAKFYWSVDLSLSPLILSCVNSTFPLRPFREFFTLFIVFFSNVIFVWFFLLLLLLCEVLYLFEKNLWLSSHFYDSYLKILVRNSNTWFIAELAESIIFAHSSCDFSGFWRDRRFSVASWTSFWWFWRLVIWVNSPISGGGCSV